ncbi:hypothetical protein VMUT_0660 [Vulcanisaeta moutnovskia 768-28]|uniref:Uncharacterized protein n=1 Tax=Vulcanisaeta moutnovskia (strain 768-28) TaxID=985053 RepID=F0QVL8_VULM7|nr:hypothetical protein [Vulcanisaeta moutnovskia]ADY00871.1 hypothetical protein VMUT_0660 [Vulcanisaeta moutnovskia 768-28]
MRSLVFLVIGIALLAIMGVAVLHAQGVNSSVNFNSGVNVTGLVASYYVHLFIAEHWIEALNASGINSTALIELINEAESYANIGNYLSAIITLNNAINLAAHLMTNAHVNSTQTVINNYVSLTSAVNNTVISNLLSNESLVNFTLRALSVLSKSDNATYIINMSMAILGNEEKSFHHYVPPNALIGLNTTMNILNMTYNALLSAGYNSTVRQIVIIKIEVITISLLTPPGLRTYVLSRVLTPYLMTLSENASRAINRLSMSLNTTIPTPPQLMECMGKINETLFLLMSKPLNEPEVYVMANDFINNYTTCLGQIKALINETNTTQVIIIKFMNITKELSNVGLSNLTPYIINTYSQCKSELINAFNSGNTTLIMQVLNQCSYKVHNYEGEVHYAIWTVNMTRNYLSYVNSTVQNLARQHGISGVTPMLCYVELNNSIMSNITSIIKAVFNGTISPMEAQTLINEYLSRVINSTPSLAAGCLGIPVAPHSYIPTSTWITTTPSATGELLIGTNGSAELTINITNPTQENLYINGFSVGGLTCSFTKAVEISANTQGALELGLAITNNRITSVSSLSASGNVEVSQGTTVNCNGHLPITYIPAVLNGKLYLSNDEQLMFFIVTGAETSTLINYGW